MIHDGKVCSCVLDSDDIEDQSGLGDLGDLWRCREHTEFYQRNVTARHLRIPQDIEQFILQNRFQRRYSFNRRSILEQDVFDFQFDQTFKNLGEFANRYFITSLKRTVLHQIRFTDRSILNKQPQTLQILLFLLGETFLHYYYESVPEAFRKHAVPNDRLLIEW